MPDLPYRLNFGGFTYSKKHSRLYMHVVNDPLAPHRICVVGLQAKVTGAKLLRTGEPLNCWQTYETARDEHRLFVELPESVSDKLDTVVALDVEGDVVAQQL